VEKFRERLDMTPARCIRRAGVLCLGDWGRALAGRKKAGKFKAGCDLPDGGECVALRQTSSASAHCNSEIEIDE